MALGYPTNATLGSPATATLNVADDDLPPTVQFSSASYNADENAGSATVTVILDCCYASQMSREAGGEGYVVRARPKLTWLGIGKRWDEIRARLGPIDAPGVAGNPKAVRIAACGEWQEALQGADARGRTGGLLTLALIDTLEEVGDAPVSFEGRACPCLEGDDLSGRARNIGRIFEHSAAGCGEHGGWRVTM